MCTLRNCKYFKSCVQVTSTTKNSYDKKYVYGKYTDLNNKLM